jgi:hypothetical protein
MFKDVLNGEKFHGKNFIIEFNFNKTRLDTYFTLEKRINIGHLFYYGETDQYWTPILLWRNRSILETYFTMEKQINIGHLFYYGETDQYWTPILLWRNGSILDAYFTLGLFMLRSFKSQPDEVMNLSNC